MEVFEINWDNVPQWIQATGAIIASVGIVFTLLLQRRTLEKQREALEAQTIVSQLEQKKYLDSKLPILELSNVRYVKSGQKRTLTFFVTIKENALRHLEIKHNFPDDYDVKVPYYISDVILPKEYVLDFTINFELSPVFIEIEEYTGNALIFAFEDVFGNKYRQQLIYKGAKNVFMHPAVRI